MWSWTLVIGLALEVVRSSCRLAARGRRSRADNILLVTDNPVTIPMSRITCVYIDKNDLY